MAVQIERRFDFSGAMQTATSWLLKKPNEVGDALNARFNHKIGAVTRRLGYIATVNSVAIATIQSGKSGLLLYEAKFNTGPKIFAATNNSGDTTTVIKTLTPGTGLWASLSAPSAIDPNTQLRMIDSLDEAYIAGKSTTTGVRIAPINVKPDLSTSATRNLIGAPECAFMVEYKGALYAINVKVNGTVYNDRAYRSSNATGVITFVQGVQVPTTTASGTFVVKVDSVRYLKAGMVLDIYKAGTETKLYDVTIASVDKNLNTINITPTTSTFASTDVNTTTDVITTGTNIPTGTPVQFSNPGTLPTGISAATTYYAINASSTTIKLAVSYSNAIAGTPVVDLTAQGSGTNTLYMGVGDNDEFWGDGRKNELAYYWNTDYPSYDKADFLRIPPGISADSEITSVAKSNNRLFMATKTAMFKWDNANLTTVYEDLGCASHDSMQTIGNWLIWVTADNTIQARNDSTGQDETISEAMSNDFLEIISAADLATSAAGISKKVYKVYLGTVNGEKWRFCYNFKANNWTREIHTRGFTKHMRSDFGGQMGLFFLDDTGKMFQDEIGNLDDTATIPFYVRFGRSNNGTEQMKNYQGHVIYGNNLAGASLKAFLDAGDPKDLGQLIKGINKIAHPDSKGAEGSDIDYEITQNSDGAPIEIEGIVTYYNPIEDRFNATKK